MYMNGRAVWGHLSSHGGYESYTYGSNGLRGYGGYGYDDGYGPDRRHFAEKSQAALRREDEAKRLFTTHVQQVAAEKVPVPSVPHVLLPPATHLRT